MKCYIYCTKAKPTIEMFNNKCHYLVYGKRNELYCLNGKIVASFDLNKVEEINRYHTYPNMFLYETKSIAFNELAYKSRLSQWQIECYLKDTKGYAWYINNLQILEEPKDITSFYTRHVIDKYGITSCSMIMKAPKNWCYAQVLGGHDCIIMSVNSNELYKILNENKTIIIKKNIPKEFK